MHMHQIDRLRAELVHLDATMRLFDPDTNPEDIFAKRRFPMRTEYFARGEVTRIIYDLIRERGEITAHEAAEVGLTQKQIPESDRKTRRDFINRFGNVLHDLRRPRRVVKVSSGPRVRGKLAP